MHGNGWLNNHYFICVALPSSKPNMGVGSMIYMAKKIHRMWYSGNTKSGKQEFTSPKHMEVWKVTSLYSLCIDKGPLLLSDSKSSPTHTQIAIFIGPTWGPTGADRTQVGPMLVPWTISGYQVIPSGYSLQGKGNHRLKFYQTNWRTSVWE